MLDRWFVEDIQQRLNSANRFVIIDPDNKSLFLKELIRARKLAKLFDISSALDELEVKYEIEKNYQKKNVIIFSNRPLQDLTFIREYCETGGILDLTYLHRYIKQKINDHLGFDLSNPAEEIIAIGRLSIGKQKNYWERIKANGNHGIFSLEDILDFLNSPKDTFKKYGKEERQLFCDYMSDFTEYALQDKPPQTISNEISNAIFDFIQKEQKEESLPGRLYDYWINSKKHEDSLKNCLDQYTLSPSIDVWKLPVNHPFKIADETALTQIIENIADRDWINSKLEFVKQRSVQAVLKILNVKYWQPVYTLFSYDVKQIDTICSLNDAAEHYTKEFYKLDNDIRRFYSLFLAEEKILKPLQNYYNQILDLFLSKWFQYFADQYKENQSKLLGRIIDEQEPPLAIIVGDAISYGISQEITYKLKKKYSIKNDIIFACYPSETSQNMSKIFMSPDEIIDKSKREKKVLTILGKDIEIKHIDDVSVTDKAKNYAIFYSDDVDSLSEKKNQKALKYYDEFINHIENKIKVLFANGYKKLILMSDHGFVLTGILDD